MRTEPIVFLPLSQGKVAVIDFADYHIVRGLKYSAKQVKRNTYAVRTIKSPITGRPSSTRLHRDILGLKAGDGLCVDHRDHNGCNNTRSNIRLCLDAENSRHRRSRLGSTSKFLGVCWSKNRSKWRSQGRLPNISHLRGGNVTYLGGYDSEIEAALAYDAFAREHYGEFSNCNFPAPALP